MVMRLFEVWYFIGLTEFYEIVSANDAEHARWIVTEQMTEFGCPAGSFFIDAILEVGK